MTTDPKILNYGVKINALKALIIDGKLSRYYKKGNLASKRCWYVYSNNVYGRPLRWVNSCETCVFRIAKFYQNLGFSVELVDIPSEISIEGEDSETE